MKNIPLLATLIMTLAPAPSLAQSALKPCEVEFLVDYYRGVDNIIDDAVGGMPRLSLTTLPSFSPEYGVRLVGDYIHLVQFSSSFWYGATSIDSRGRGREDFSSTQIETRTYRTEMSASIANRIKQAYTEAIAGSQKSDRMGLDGVSYRFTTPETGCGEAWSPDPDTPNSRLVELSELLANHAKLSKPRQIQRSEEVIATLLTYMGH